LEREALMIKKGFILLSFLSCVFGWGAVLSEPGVYLLPMNCSELLPDPTPFTNYLEAVGRGLVSSNSKLSSRIFKVLAIRQKVGDAFDRQRDQHPVDVLVRKTLCFYRDTKEPLKPVTYDDTNFVSYLSASMPELEKKVNDIVYQFELEEASRKQFEKILEGNSQLIRRLKTDAEDAAQAEIDKIARKARSQVKGP